LQLAYRFLAGGLIVSLFAAMGDVLKPKSFAGLFGAAPSVALATLALTILANGKAYAAMEARSMIAGALAFVVYACLCARLMTTYKLYAAAAAVSALVVWIGCALCAGFLLAGW
jgi:hypothetical protein